MNSLVVAGLNHKTAPVGLRERCASGDPEAALRELAGLAEEAALLSTCNRFEVYAAGPRDPEALLGWIAARAGTSRDALDGRLYVRSGRNAAKHLFFVASSLDSLVVGETQVRAQVKEAYGAAVRAGCVGPRLHRAFQAALRVSKEIADATGVGRGNVSVAGAAADLAERVFGDLARASVLVVGAGETADLVLSHLGWRGVRRATVANRTRDAAVALAERHGAAAEPLSALESLLPEADVVVAAAGAADPLVSAAAVRAALRRRRGRPIVFVDVAVPRGVDPAVDGLDNVYRYDMDALEAVTTDALRHRRKEFLQCCTLVDAAALRLEVEVRSHEAGSAIAALEDAYAALGEREMEELERKLPHLGADERHAIRRTIHRLVRKFLHMPVRSLREGDPERADAVRRAFALPGDGDA